MVRTLSVIGAGRVGATLAALWQRGGVAETVGVLNRSPVSSRAAQARIGAGEPAADLPSLAEADLYLIGVNDDAIDPVTDRLAADRDLTGRIVFHCSGSLASAALAAARRRGALTASVHPVRTFADPGTDPDAEPAAFAGTYCGHEGDPGALAVLVPMFEAIGGRPFAVDAPAKPIYHAAGVFAMNYLVALVEIGLRCYEDAGVPPDVGLRILDPLLRQAVDNVVEHGPVRALTGPIARGDAQVVARQLDELAARDPDRERLYALLGLTALDLSRRAGRADPDDLDVIATLLAEHLG